MTWPDSSHRLSAPAAVSFYDPLPLAATACCSWSPAELVTENVLMTLRSEMRWGGGDALSLKLNLGHSIADWGAKSKIQISDLHVIRYAVCVYIISLGIS